MAKISRTKQDVILELNAVAAQRLLYPCLVAAVLIMSGFNIP
jgi:hypothetical protein